MKVSPGGAWLRSAVAVAVLSAQATLLAAPGFGTIRKRVIQLQVRQPAVVRLANTSIGFRGKVTNREYSPILASLEATLETQLVSNERTLIKKSPAEAEWVLELTVTGFSISQPRKRTERVNNASVSYVRWIGSLNIAYQVLDKKGAVHDADNIQYAYDREFQEEAQAARSSSFRIPAIPGLTRQKADEVVPHSAEDVKQILLKQVVAQAGSNLSNTVQSVEARVAAGEDHLDRAATFLDQRLWARAIEELEKTPSFPKSEDESYRQYDLALAYEAMSYSSENYNEQRNNLFKAQEYYDKALELNPGQRYFVEVVARTKESVARYRKLDAMKKDDQRRTPAAVPAVAGSSPAPAATGAAPAPAVAGSSPAPAAGPTSSNKPARKALTVADVIELFAASVPASTIIEVIQESPADYDLLDKDTILAITKAKLPVSVQNAMRKKVGMGPLPGAAAPARAAPAPGAAAATPGPAGSSTTRTK